MDTKLNAAAAVAGLAGTWVAPLARRAIEHARDIEERLNELAVIESPEFADSVRSLLSLVDARQAVNALIVIRQAVARGRPAPEEIRTLHEQMLWVLSKEEREALYSDGVVRRDVVDAINLAAEALERTKP
jgi:hypothetical protein